MVVGIQSRGLAEFLKLLTKEIYCIPCSTRKDLNRRTKRKTYKGDYVKKLDVKRRRRSEKRDKTKITLKQSRRDKKRGTTYQSGMSIFMQPLGTTNSNKEQCSSDLVTANSTPSIVPARTQKNNLRRISSFAKISNTVVNRQIYNANSK